MPGRCQFGYSAGQAVTYPSGLQLTAGTPRLVCLADPLEQLGALEALRSFGAFKAGLNRKLIRCFA